MADLPVLPSVGMQLIKLLNDPNSTSQKLGAVLEQDPGLVAKVLRRANSAYYGLRNEVRTVSHAISLLGTNQIRTLAMNFAFLQLSSKTLGDMYFMVRDFLLHCLCSANLCQTLGTRLKTRLVDPEEAYIAGLLHDMGAYTLGIMLGDKYAPALQSIQHQGPEELPVEHAALGYDHCQTGAWLGARWRLPEHYIEVLGCHHNPPETCEYPELLALTQIADYLTCQRGVSYLPLAEPPALFPGVAPILQRYMPEVAAEDLPAVLQEQFADELEAIIAAVEEMLSINEGA